MKWARGHTTLVDMEIRKKFIAPLLLAAGAAAAIAAAPTAMADNNADPPPVFPHDHTTLVGSLPGNNQINASPPVNFAPQYPYWEGDSYGGYSRGGFGGGGFGGSHGGGGHH